MFAQQSLAYLLWRLRRQSALYIFGSGASAPVAPFAPAIMQQTAAAFIHLGGFSPTPAPKTLMLERIRLQVKGVDFFPELRQRPGTQGYPTDAAMLRLSHGGAFAGYVHHLAGARFARQRIANYAVVRTFRRSVMLNYNLDGLAADTCGTHHWIVDVHGSVDAAYGGPAGANMMRVAQEYGIEFDLEHDDLWPIGPELVTDVRLHRKLQTLMRCIPAFVMIVGYSFGKAGESYDDQVSLDSFIRRFRGAPIDVYVLEPRPFGLAEMLSEQLQSNRVHAFPVYWNVLAWALMQVLARRLDVAALDYFHEKTLDDQGSSVIFHHED